MSRRPRRQNKGNTLGDASPTPISPNPNPIPATCSNLSSDSQGAPPKTDSTELVKHVSIVNTTLIVGAAVLAIAYIAAADRDVQICREDLRNIDRFCAPVSQGLLSKEVELIATSNSRGSYPHFDTLSQIADKYRIPDIFSDAPLPHGGFNLHWDQSSQSHFRLLVPKSRKLLTLSDFASYWNELESCKTLYVFTMANAEAFVKLDNDNPQWISLDNVLNLGEPTNDDEGFRAGIAPAYPWTNPARHGHSPTLQWTTDYSRLADFGADVSTMDAISRMKCEAAQSPGWPKDATHTFIREVQVAGKDESAWIAIPLFSEAVPLDGQQAAVNFARKLCMKDSRGEEWHDWKKGKFDQTFSRLHARTRLLADNALSEIDGFLQGQQQPENADVKIAEVSIPASSIRTIGTGVLVVMQLYFLITLWELESRVLVDDKCTGYPWHGFYRSFWSRVVCVVGSTVFPLSVCAALVWQPITETRVLPRAVCVLLLVSSLSLCLATIRGFVMIHRKVSQ